MGAVSSRALELTLLGGVIAGGVVLLAYALTSRPDPARPPGRDLRSVATGLDRRWLIAIGAGLVTVLVTRWLVAGVAAVTVAIAWPALFGGLRDERRAMARLEGLAAWTESLRDTVAGAAGLEQAIPVTAATAAPAIAAALRSLTDRLRVRMPMRVALQRFADDLDDPSADLIVAALILNARLRGPGLRDVLTSLARSGRAELDMRRRIAAGRRATTRSVQIVTGVTVLFVVGLSLLNPGYVEPYGTFLGQVVLSFVCAIFAAGFLWLQRLSRVDMPQRFLRARVDLTARAVPSVQAHGMTR